MPRNHSNKENGNENMRNSRPDHNQGNTAPLARGIMPHRDRARRMGGDVDWRRVRHSGRRRELGRRHRDKRDTAALSANLPEGCTLVCENGVLSAEIKAVQPMILIIR